MYYPCSENNGAGQLCGYREADLRVCFRICRVLVLPAAAHISIIRYFAYTCISNALIPFGTI